MPQGGKNTNDWWGKGEPQHSQPGGLGAQMWRQNMRQLKDHLFDEPYPMAEFLQNMCEYLEKCTGLGKGEWESARAFLQRCKQQLPNAAGLP